MNEPLLHNTRLQSIISKLPVLAAATNITALSGGLTNMNYRIDTPGNSFVMRVSDTATSLLGIDRERERINTAKAHQAGVGAEVIGFLPKENVLLISWIDAKTLNADEIHANETLLPRIAGSLRKLHGGAAFNGEFYFPVIRKKYLEIVLKENYFLPEDYLQIEEKIIELEKKLSETAESLVPCNNDLLAENFLDDGEKIWIIDYEYSGQNEASFEIGNFSSEVFLDDEQLTILCNAYWGKHIPEKIYRAMAWSMIARFGWVMWASIQEAVSHVDFDFRVWGRKKWNSVLPELTGDRYEKIISGL
jgi:thiamine kinase-like enzyme